MRLKIPENVTVEIAPDPSSPHHYIIRNEYGFEDRVPKGLLRNNNLKITDSKVTIGREQYLRCQGSYLRHLVQEAEHCGNIARDLFIRLLPLLVRHRKRLLHHPLVANLTVPSVFFNKKHFELRNPPLNVLLGAWAHDVLVASCKKCGGPSYVYCSENLPETKQGFTLGFCVICNEQGLAKHSDTYVRKMLTKRRMHPKNRLWGLYSGEFARRFGFGQFARRHNFDKEKSVFDIGQLARELGYDVSRRPGAYADKEQVEGLRKLHDYLVNIDALMLI